MLLKVNRNKTNITFSFKKEDLIKYGENVRVFGDGVTIDNFKFKTGSYPTNVYFLFKRGSSIIPMYIWSDGPKTDTETEIFLAVGKKDFNTLPYDYYRVTALFTNDNLEFMCVDLNLQISGEEEKEERPLIGPSMPEDPMDEQPLEIPGTPEDNLGNENISGEGDLPDNEIEGL